VGLFIVTMGLVTAALLQLRREFELARLRSDFVASVSHELRTPLAQIRLFAETLRLGRVRSEEEGRRSLEIIDQEAGRLTHLVENVLHFSRAERRGVHLSLAPVDLDALVRAVVHAFAPLAAAREVKLVQEIEPEVKASVDPAAVRQMLINLLDNAVKYGPCGQTVTVGMKISGRAAELRVEDQGPGIEPADRARIWERFFRLKRETKTAAAGAGIGLAVVKELAILHGGRAWVEDAPGGGARFAIEFPGAWRADGEGA
jgi:signal transduction histidine kinase